MIVGFSLNSDNRNQDHVKFSEMLMTIDYLLTNIPVYIRARVLLNAKKTWMCLEIINYHGVKNPLSLMKRNILRRIYKHFD